MVYEEEEEECSRQREEHMHRPEDAGVWFLGRTGRVRCSWNIESKEK